MLFLIAAFVSLLLTGAVILLLAKEQYTPMIIIGVVCAICYYASVFLFFFYDDARTAVRLIGAADGAADFSAETVAPLMGWKVKATNKFLKKCKKRKYI